MKRRCFEEEAHLKGYRLIAGVDEAGRGPLAGPVVAAACILPLGCKIEGIDDSKQLTSEQREELYNTFLSSSDIEFGIGVVDHLRIDKINILQASLEAMSLAVKELSCKPDFLLIDGIHIPKIAIPARALIKGDALSESIGAASIIAKHHRDKMMIAYHDKWPEYGFDRNKGYPTKEHLSVLQKYGPCPIHRHSFAPVRDTKRT